MKLKIFDVVELKNGNKATILNNFNGIYKAEIVDEYGKTQGVKNIENADIKSIIVSK